MTADSASDSDLGLATAPDHATTPDPDPDAVVAVPCEGDDVLTLFALGTGERLGAVPVGSHPVHATTCHGTAFVATMGERSVTAVDADGEVTRIETGVLGPSHFAATEQELFVACSAGDALAVLDPESLTLSDRIAVGAEPHELAIDPDESRLYSGSRREGIVDVIDAETHERIAAVDAGADARVQGVTLSPDGARGYAVDQRGARVVAFDTEAAEQRTRGDADGDADAIVATAAVGADPYDLVVTTDRVFVPGRADGTVHEFDRNLSLLAVHDGFSRPVDLLRLNDDWWVLDAAASRVRSLGGDVVETTAPGLVATAVDGRLVVSHYDDDRVSLVDVESGTVWAADSPSYPFGSVVV